MSDLDDDDRREAVAQFRAEIIGHLLRRDLPRGALASAFEELSQRRYRPPGADKTRRYAASTLERWYYAYKNGGLEALKPKARSDRGHAQMLSDQMRELLCEIRREHPSASVPLILRTLIAEGRLDEGVVSASTIRRLFASRGLSRQSGHEPDDGHQRMVWEAEAPMSLWHGDVLYGPRLEKDGDQTRIHGMLDDASRMVVALEARRTEKEQDMLRVFADALRRRGKPDALYLDNGSTYTGDKLQQVCARLEIGLIHASPGDPQARGKMERFWRTLREGSLDHLGRLESLHDLNVRLRAFLDQHYHHAPHAGLMGQAPKAVFADETGSVERIDEQTLQRAFLERDERRVRKDSTLQFEGTTYEVDQRFLCSRTVEVCRPLLDSEAEPWIECEDKRFAMHPVDPKQNADRDRPEGDEAAGDEQTSRSFDPNTALLDRASGCTSTTSTHQNED